ncbi:hypothetical protein SARC_05413 [Sphaeroforma arctica JP610]|uniref:Uncharacterized protein n=1 Tax=Sphaeroforma arctica JP610 TaxID=667725 RepID=A0A0L0G0B5_9EUKA|nr:hypothetical protein SARC_05413 [Sphaeroforma arctica JP610]KNC82294.1 hypothetical protein SARC_05413 [Sphaeroforma arctica JP610]|eukprot:XP_014156196.1 hypothetical protein SARC_05413 [Sphaeroforma arctica JP610]
MQQIDIPEAITAQFLTGFPENWMVLAEEYFDTLKASAQQYASDSEDERHARDIESFAPNTKPEEKESHATAAGERVPAGEVHEREKDIDAVPSSGDEETSVATEKSTSVKKKPQSPAKNALKPPTTARKTPTKVGKTHTTRATRSHPEVIVPAATEPTQTSTTKKSTTIRKAGRARAGSDGGSDHEDRRDTKRTRTSTQLPQENRVIAREATNTAQITDPEAEIPSITKQNSSHIQEPLAVAHASALLCCVSCAPSQTWLQT